MNLFSFLLKTSRLTVILAIITGLISGVARASLIAMITGFINGNQTVTSSLVWNFILFLAIVLAAGVISQVLLIHLAEGAILKLRLMMSRQILASPLRQLEEIGSHRLLVTLTDDIEAISQAVNAIPFLCVNIAIVIGCLIYLASLSLSLLLFLVGFVILAVLSHQLMMGKAFGFLKRAREQQDQLFRHFETITAGIKELKLHRQRSQNFLSEDLSSTALAFRQDKFYGLTLFAIAINWGLLLFFVAIGLILLGLAPLLNVSNLILTGYALTVIYLIGPLEGIVRELPIFAQSGIALQKVESLGLSLAKHEKNNSVLEPTKPKSDFRRLELVDVTHAYHRERENSKFVLGPINLSFEPGELVFIVGGNGSGKSTLAKLITGLYIPETGEIRLDGQSVTNENLDNYRQLFSVVFSDFYLFESLLGLTGPDLATQAQYYLNKLQLDHKVQIENAKLSTTALSQGQRKRLALLTAYLEDRPIYLFDEWASDQDPLFREIFYTQLLQELKQKNKAVLVISHDDHYFHLADRIIKLNYGQIEQDKSFVE